MTTKDATQSPTTASPISTDVPLPLGLNSLIFRARVVVERRDGKPIAADDQARIEHALGLTYANKTLRTLRQIAKDLHERTDAWWQVRKEWRGDESTKKSAGTLSDRLRDATAAVERLEKEECTFMDTFGGTTLEKHGLRAEKDKG